jgi:hypothetical protein
LGLKKYVYPKLGGGKDVPVKALSALLIYAPFDWWTVAGSNRTLEEHRTLMHAESLHGPNFGGL